MRNSSNLTEKQLRWVDEYLLDSNAAAAARRCGYSAKCARSIGHENLTKPDVLTLLAQKRATLANDLQITRQGVINGILEGIQIARDDRLPAVMIRGYSELARMLGYFEPEVRRVEVSAGDGLTHLERLSDSELRKIITAGQAAAQ